MPTNQKTPLGLNSWLGTDKPMRSDFVEDNALLDTLLTAHFSDAQKHLSEADRTLLEQGIYVGEYTGDGAPSRDIALPFPPRAVLLFLRRVPANVFRAVPGYNESNFGVATQVSGTQGVALAGTVLTVNQTQEAPSGGGVLTNLNHSGDGYLYLAFR